MILAPTIDDIERLAQQAVETIPAELRRFTTELVVRIEDFPDEETEREMDLETPFDLLGLYRGTGEPVKGTGASGAMPDMVFLYRRPLLDYWCETGEDLAHLVRHVMIHEIGHHFGFSDEDMERLEADDSPLH